MTEHEKDSQEPVDASQELTAEQLEQVNGGIGLLLPAVQKVREAAQKVHPGGVNVLMGDGSVRFVK